MSTDPKDVIDNVDEEDVQNAAETAADEFEEIDDSQISDEKKSFFSWWLRGVGIVVAALLTFGPLVFLGAVHVGIVTIEPFVIGGERLEIAKYIEWFIAGMLGIVLAITVIAALVKAPGDYLAAISRMLASLGGSNNDE